MFDLEESVREWREQMLTAGIQTPVPLEELESHLRDEFERQMQGGMGAPSAFEEAARQIGEAPVIHTEFAKLEGPSTMRTMIKMLARIAAFAAVFIIGMTGVVVWEQWPALTGRPTQFTIAVSGPSGLPFTGVIKSGTNVMPVSGIAPTNYVLMAHAVDCRFEKQQPEGELGVCLTMKYLNGTVSVTSSESEKGVAAFLSLHNGHCSSF